MKEKIVNNELMVDLHCHILPGVDDGARSIEESLLMIKKSEESGVGILVATPHLLKGAYEISISERDQITAELQKAVIESGISIQIKSGYECDLSPEIFTDTSRLEQFTINNNGRYILVEFPLYSIPSYTEEILFNIRIGGIIPIIAHPERNTVICQDPNILFDFVSNGCISQIDAGSLLGHFGKASKQIAQILITHNLAHLVASDMHSISCPLMDQAIPPVEELVGSEAVLLMFSEIPRKIVAGETFRKDPPQYYKPIHKGLRNAIFGRRKSGYRDEW